MKAVLFVLLFTIGMVPAASPAKSPNFSGDYEAALRGKSFLSLAVKQTDSSATIDFSAGNKDGSGTAPDGSGTGKLNARGELVFTFEDSFENKGRGVLRRDGKTFRLSLQLTDIKDPRAAQHYGERSLRRVQPKKS